MGYGPVKIFTKTMITGATLTTTPIDLGKAYGGYSIEIPTMVSGCDVYLQGAATSDGTYRRLYYQTGDNTPVALAIGSAASNGIFALDAYLPQFVKIEVTTAVSNDVTVFKIYGHD